MCVSSHNVFSTLLYCKVRCFWFFSEDGYVENILTFTLLPFDSRSCPLSETGVAGCTDILITGVTDGALPTSPAEPARYSCNAVFYAKESRRNAAPLCPRAPRN